MKIGICGATGKVGQALIEQINASEGLYKLVAQFSRSSALEEIDQLFFHSDVIIDFSNILFLEPLLKAAKTYKKKLVIGTTGLKEEHYKLLKVAGRELAIVYGANMSIGANLLKLLASKAAVMLGEDFDTEIVETHHRFKKDAPSGTALELGQAIATTKSLDLSKIAVYNRAACERQKQHIGFSSIRGGGIFGDHEVIFAGLNEVISLKHSALNRAVYAEGALKAAEWILNKEPGLYSMQDILAIF